MIKSIVELSVSSAESEEYQGLKGGKTCSSALIVSSLSGVKNDHIESWARLMKKKQNKNTLSPAYHTASLPHKDKLYPPVLKVFASENSYEEDLLTV